MLASNKYSKKGSDKEQVNIQTEKTPYLHMTSLFVNDIVNVEWQWLCVIALLHQFHFNYRLKWFYLIVSKARLLDILCWKGGISGRIYGIYIIIALKEGNLCLLHTYKNDVAVRVLNITSPEGLAGLGLSASLVSTFVEPFKIAVRRLQIPASPLLPCLWA